MLVNLLVGSLLMILTTIMHAIATQMALGFLRTSGAVRRARKTGHGRSVVLAAVVLFLFLVSLLESGLWAVTYLVTGAMKDPELAFYFSTVTLTALGYGDVTAAAGWRLLASFEAANGLILFGWTTAIIVAVVQRMYFSLGSRERQPPLATAARP